MKIIPYSVNSGEKNMQIDEDLLINAIKVQSKEVILRFYGWEPACISLGRNQNNTFIDYELIKELNIDVVRRLTGGRALLHDKELTYSVVASEMALRNGKSIIDSYKEISQILINIFNKLGIELEFGNNKAINMKNDYCMLLSTGADLCHKGKKFIGSAQCRKNGYILQHGSILIDYDKELLEKLFKESISTDSITSLKEINSSITIESILAASR